MGKYIVTDLTRFKEGKAEVCTALISEDSGQCVRPIPYFTFEQMRKYGVIPGAVIEGDFTPAAIAGKPHREDCSYGTLQLTGAVSASDFRAVLQRSISNSVKEGFGSDFDGIKLLPIETKAERSIITVKVDPDCFKVEKDRFGNYKVHFTDSSGVTYRYIPITDLGFHQYLKGVDQSSMNPVDEVNSHFKGSHEIYLRLGVSRAHQSQDGRNGYWMQVNGIYSFPDRLDKIRGYAP